MSEKNTGETKDSRSFEERVFLRFDAMDSRFETIDRRFDEVNKRFDAIDERFEKVESRLDRVEIRLDSVQSKLTSLDGRVEQLEMKQYDTKPIWEQALVAITDTNVRIDDTNNWMEQGFAEIRTEMKEGFATLRDAMEHSINGVERKIDVLNHNILQAQADQRYVDRRLEHLESQPKSTRGISCDSLLVNKHL